MKRADLLHTIMLSARDAAAREGIDCELRGAEVAAPGEFVLTAWGMPAEVTRLAAALGRQDSLREPKVVEEVGRGEQEAARGGRRRPPPSLAHRRGRPFRVVMGIREAAGNGLSHAEFLALVLQNELAMRADRQLQRRVKAAQFREPKAPDDFDWSFPRSCAASDSTQPRHCMSADRLGPPRAPARMTGRAQAPRPVG